MNKFYGFLGICAKAGTVASGAFAVEKAIKSGKATLVIVAEDASENATEDYKKLCNGYDVKLMIIGSRQLLGKSIGKDERVAIAITDDKMSETLIEKAKELSED